MGMRIEVDCERIRRNTQAVVDLCAPAGIEVVGVTKACCGHPDVARAMLAGGAALLGESRLDNVRRLRKARIEAPIMLLRLPSLQEAEAVVLLAQISLNSQVETVRALSRACQRYGIRHQVILMIEAGDRREGVLPEHALDAARRMADQPDIDLVGVGANLTCIGGVLPTYENTRRLVETAEAIEAALGIGFTTISAGNSASLALLLRGEMPSRATQLRIGGAILTGEVDSTGDWPHALPHQDAFLVAADVIEIEEKPSAPEGRTAPNAFGEIPAWTDRGVRRRAIAALGRQDLQVESLIPYRSGVDLLGASSDHLVLDVTEADPPVHLGEELAFRPLYGAVATGMASTSAVQVVKPAGLCENYHK